MAPIREVGDLALFGVVEQGLDLVDDRVELDGRDRPLLAGLHEARAKLVAVEPLPPAVVLDDHVRDLLDRFVGGEPATAGGAFPAAADDLALAALAGVHDPVVHGGAEGALHSAEEYRFCYSTVSRWRSRSLSRRQGLPAKSAKPMIEIGTKETACAMRATPVAVATGTRKTLVRANWTAA